MPTPKDISTVNLGPGKLHNDSAIVPAPSGGTGSGGLSSKQISFVDYVEENSGSTLTIDITGVDVYVGDGSIPVEDLFKVVDANGNMFLGAGGSPILAASVTNFGAGVHSGTVTVTFTEAVPAGVKRVYYPRATTLANLPLSAPVYPAVARSPQTEGYVEELLMDLQGGNKAWDANWTSTVHELARSGLNERYRRSTTAVTGTLDTPGDGAIILRDGQAPTSQSVLTNLTTNPYPDAYLALWKAQLGPRSGAGSRVAAPDPAYSGHVQYMALGSKKTRQNNDLVKQGVQTAMFFGGYEKDVDDVGVSTNHTVISPTLGATLNPTSGADATSKRTVQLTAPGRFRDGSGNTGIHLGYDLLEITFPNGSQQAHVIEALDGSDATIATLRSLSGALSDFGESSVAVTVKWIHTTFAVGGETEWQQGGSVGSHLGSGLTYLAPTLNGLGGAGTQHSFPARFAAASTDGGFASHQKTAICFGATGTDGQPVTRGYLYGDGGIDSLGGRVRAFFGGRAANAISVTTDPVTLAINPTSNASSQGSVYEVRIFDGGGSLDIELDPSYIPQIGDTVTFVIWRHSTAVLGNTTIEFDSTVFVFSGNDDDLSGVAGDMHMIRAVYAPTENGNRFLVTRTDYKV